MKRLIDAGHLKDRIMNERNGSWYDLYNMLAIIDSEPTERKEGLSPMILLIPVVVFLVIMAILWFAF